MYRKLHEVPMLNVEVRDAFWSSRQHLMTDVTIPYMEKILRDEVPGAAKSHAIDNFRMAAGEQTGEFYGMVFQDSDVAKWLEAAAYSLAIKPDKELAARVRDIVALVGRAQQADGYLNTYFTVSKSIPRWTNLLECHELYCAGHMIEAAVALHEAAGMDELLQICLRMVDHIIGEFGEGGRVGLPGHQEIELALLRLYRVTGDKRHLDLAMRFLDLRGQDPHYFENNTPDFSRGIAFGEYGMDPADTLYNQSDVPVRDQTTPRGHAVRQVYMLVGMADAAAATGDKALFDACVRMFDAITERQMYVTGAVGARAFQESFSVDYDLPPDRVYGETCASVAMAFFARNLLALDPDGRYADLLELQLYNGTISGMQLDGKRFFYVNPLQTIPGVSGVAPGYEHVKIDRPQWYNCACCPPNLARLITSLGGYLYGENDDTVFSHLFIGSRAKTQHADITLESEYPWNGRAVYTIDACRAPFTFAIHIPAHVQNLRITLNGQPAQAELVRGYAYLKAAFSAGDRIEVLFDMPPRRLYTHPLVKDTAGQAALARGPIVYCFEAVDNGADILSRTLPRDADIQALPYDASLLGGIVALEAAGLRAIPYYAWSNRGENAMTVFLSE